MEQVSGYALLAFLALAIIVRVILANFVKEDAEYYERRGGVWWFFTLIGGEFAVAIYRWLR